MTLRKPILTATTVCAAIFMTLGSATSSPKHTPTTVHIHSGPSSADRVVALLGPGEMVTARRCLDTGWCYVSFFGREGWVSARFLSATHVPQHAVDLAPVLPIEKIEMVEFPLNGPWCGTVTEYDSFIITDEEAFFEEMDPIIDNQDIIIEEEIVEEDDECVFLD